MLGSSRCATIAFSQKAVLEDGDEEREYLSLAPSLSSLMTTTRTTRTTRTTTMPLELEGARRPRLGRRRWSMSSSFVAAIAIAFAAFAAVGGGNDIGVRAAKAMTGVEAGLGRAVPDGGGGGGGIVDDGDMDDEGDGLRHHYLHSVRRRRRPDSSSPFAAAAAAAAAAIMDADAAVKSSQSLRRVLDDEASYVGDRDHVDDDTTTLVNDDNDDESEGESMANEYDIVAAATIQATNFDPQQQLQRVSRHLQSALYNDDEDEGDDAHDDGRGPARAGVARAGPSAAAFASVATRPASVAASPNSSYGSSARVSTVPEDPTTTKNKKNAGAKLTPEERAAKKEAKRKKKEAKKKKREERLRKKAEREAAGQVDGAGEEGGEQGIEQRGPTDGGGDDGSGGGVMQRVETSGGGVVWTITTDDDSGEGAAGGGEATPNLQPSKVPGRCTPLFAYVTPDEICRRMVSCDPPSPSSSTEGGTDGSSTQEPQDDTSDGCAVGEICEPYPRCAELIEPPSKVSGAPGTENSPTPKRCTPPGVSLTHSEICIESKTCETQADCDDVVAPDNLARKCVEHERCRTDMADGLYDNGIGSQWAGPAVGPGGFVPGGRPGVLPFGGAPVGGDGGQMMLLPPSSGAGRGRGRSLGNRDEDEGVPWFELVHKLMRERPSSRPHYRCVPKDLPPASSSSSSSSSAALTSVKGNRRREEDVTAGASGDGDDDDMKQRYYGQCDRIVCDYADDKICEQYDVQLTCVEVLGC